MDICLLNNDWHHAAPGKQVNEWPLCGMLFYLLETLKHKDSFGKSENLSKIFFAEILVFDHDYEGKSSSSNNLLWISFIFLK